MPGHREHGRRAKERKHARKKHHQEQKEAKVEQREQEERERQRRLDVGEQGQGQNVRSRGSRAGRARSHQQANGLPPLPEEAAAYSGDVGVGKGPALPSTNTSLRMRSDSASDAGTSTAGGDSMGIHEAFATGNPNHRFDPKPVFKLENEDLLARKARTDIGIGAQQTSSFSLKLEDNLTCDELLKLKSIDLGLKYEDLHLSVAAVALRRFDILKKILKEKGRLLSLAKPSLTPFGAAIVTFVAHEPSEWHMINFLIEQDPYIFQQDSFGNTPLIKAALRQPWDELSFLELIRLVGVTPELNAALTKSNNAGVTLLHAVSFRGWIEALREVLMMIEASVGVAKHIDVAMKDGTTPLMLAVELRHEAIAEGFLALGADPNAEDKAGFSVFCRCFAGKIPRICLNDMPSMFDLILSVKEEKLEVGKEWDARAYIMKIVEAVTNYSTNSVTNDGTYFCEKFHRVGRFALLFILRCLQHGPEMLLKAKIFFKWYKAIDAALKNGSLDYVYTACLSLFELLVYSEHVQWSPARAQFAEAFRDNLADTCLDVMQATAQRSSSCNSEVLEIQPPTESLYTHERRIPENKSVPLSALCCFIQVLDSPEMGPWFSKNFKALQSCYKLVKRSKNIVNAALTSQHAEILGQKAIAFQMLMFQEEWSPLYKQEVDPREKGKIVWKCIFDPDKLRVPLDYRSDASEDNVKEVVKPVRKKRAPDAEPLPFSYYQTPSPSARSTSAQYSSSAAKESGGGRGIVDKKSQESKDYDRERRRKLKTQERESHRSSSTNSNVDGKGLLERQNENGKLNLAMLALLKKTEDEISNLLLGDQTELKSKMCALEDSITRRIRDFPNLLFQHGWMHCYHCSSDGTVIAGHFIYKMARTQWFLEHSVSYNFDDELNTMPTEDKEFVCDLDQKLLRCSEADGGLTRGPFKGIEDEQNSKFSLRRKFYNLHFFQLLLLNLQESNLSTQTNYSKLYDLSTSNWRLRALESASETSVHNPEVFLKKYAFKPFKSPERDLLRDCGSSYYSWMLPPIFSNVSWTISGPVRKEVTENQVKMEVTALVQSSVPTHGKGICKCNCDTSLKQNQLQLELLLVGRCINESALCADLFQPPADFFVKIKETLFQHLEQGTESDEVLKILETTDTDTNDTAPAPPTVDSTHEEEYLEQDEEDDEDEYEDLDVETRTASTQTSRTSLPRRKRNSSL